MKRFERYGLAANSHDVIKAVAILLMIVDHLGVYVFDNNTLLRLIGRGSAPLFFFATGYVSKHRLRADILVYGLVLTASTYFLQQSVYINILINFMLIHAVLNQCNPKDFSSSQLLGFFIAASIAHVFIAPFFEYGLFGLLCAIGARLLAQNDSRGVSYLIGSLCLYFIYNSLSFGFIKSDVWETLFVFICVGLFAVFYTYHWRTFNLPSTLNTVILFLGRYSLEIYILHLLGLQLWHKLL